MLKKNTRIIRKSNRAKRRELERSIEKKDLQLDNISPLKLLYKIKYELPPSQSQSLLNSISDRQFAFIVGDLLPLNYGKIRDKSIIYSKNEFNKEIIWYKTVLADYAEEINKFLSLEQHFESAFLAGKYADCDQILFKIESEICVSHWTIEKRLLLAEYQHGFKKNKEVLTGIVSQKINNITSIFAKYTSIKVEKNQSFLKYEEMVTDFLQTFNDEWIKEYLQYKLNVYSKNFYQYKGFILGAESSSSIIDMYLAFINIITMTVSQRVVIKDEKETIQLVTNELADLVDDNRLKLINYLYDDKKLIHYKANHTDYLKILNLYIIGDYKETKARCEIYLKRETNCFEIFVIYSKCCIRLGFLPQNILPVDSFGHKTLADIYNILLKNDETQASLTNLQKTLNILGRFPWTFKAYTFLTNQHSIADDKVNITKMSHIYSHQLNPVYAIYMGGFELSEHFLSDLYDNDAGLDIINFWKNICIKLDSVDFPLLPSTADAFRQRIFDSQILQINGRFEEALTAYKSLYADNDYSSEWMLLYNQEEIIHGMLYCNLSLNDLQAAVELVTDANIECPNIAIRLRNESLIEKICVTQVEGLISDISTPIFLHQYQKYIAPNELWIAYDNFLNFHGLDFPSELSIIQERFDRKKLIYFLRFICKPEVYDSSYLFESQDHLENERIEVCLLLSELDEENFEMYFSEISEISRNQLIRQGIKQIDESKIYVDVPGIRKAVDKDLSESFIRLMNLLSLPLSQIDKLDTSNDDYLISYYDKLSEGSKTAGSKIRITTYSRFEQCKELFFKLRDMFIASNEFGIDTYLSMRIRHGTLLGEIRSVFEDYQLITKKDESSEKYQNNDFWLEKIFFKTDEEKASFNTILAEFSANIDNISNDLRNKQLQISTEKKLTDGLFDYSFFDNELLPPLKWLEVVEDHNDFFGRSVELLWERTEVILSIIREEISVPIKNKVLQLLSEMAENLEMCVNKHEQPELNDLIRNIMLCKTDISNKLDKISEWFNRTNNKVINEFYLDLPIEASIGTLKRVKEYVNFAPSIDNTCSIKFEGDTFPHFTYVMQNLLHNILKHSHLPPAVIDVNVSASESNGELSLLITNNFSDIISLDDLNQKIKNTRQLLTEAHNNDRTRGEGGTGYLKIRKTIVTDLKEESYQINISDVNDERIFRTEIRFNILKLQKTQNESFIN
jgi:hypothetical protein